MEEETDYYKVLTDTMDSREKQRCALQNEILKLREKQIALLIQLQEHVHPKKICALAEAKTFQKNELNNGKEAMTELDDTVECNKIPALQISFEEINSLINKADAFLEEHQNTL